MLVAIVWFLKRQRAANRKTIRDFPNKGDPPRFHNAEWKGENFDRLLSKHVRFARSANAIDETRKDFRRVAWGGMEDSVNEPTPGIDRLIQLWFAGNHSDIGGSYPETESRLSDVALAWMCEQAIQVPEGLKTGPIYIDGVKMLESGDTGPALNIYPRADGVQHCEIAGMRDTLDGYATSFPKWRWLQRYIAKMNWQVETREIRHNAPVHPSVNTRFALPEVIQCAKVGAYRPEALRFHDNFKNFYSNA
jgi:uncharacterized protein (DUF2235 family)